MSCKKCGSKLGPQDIYCGNCGAKKEKKNNRLLIILILLLLCTIIGCTCICIKKYNEKNNKDIKKIGACIENMLNINNTSITIDLEAEEKYLDEIDNQKINIVGDIDFQNKVAKLNLKINMEDFNYEIPAYLDFKSENMILYYYTSSLLEEDENLLIPTGWHKEISKNIFNDLSKSIQVLNPNREIDINKFDFANKLASNDEIDSYHFHINKTALEQLEENGIKLLSNIEFSQEDEYDMNITFNKKNNYITKISLDYKNEEIDYSYFEHSYINMELSNINNIKEIIIPEEALNSEEYDFDNLGKNQETMEKETIIGYSKAVELSYTQYIYDKELNNGISAQIIENPSLENINTGKVILISLNDKKIYLAVDFSEPKVVCSGENKIEQGKLTLNSCTIDTSDNIYNYQEGTVTKIK